MSTEQLTELQERFCREYVIDRNATQALIRAGGAAKSAHVTASRWLKLAKVVARVETLAAESAERVMAKKADEEHKAATEDLADYVVRTLVENVERAMQRVPVLDKEGKETGVWKYEGAVANGALKLLGETRGLFKKVEETRDLTVEDELRRLSKRARGEA